MKVTALDLPDAPDIVEALSEELPEETPVEELQHGLKAWTNPINGFRVVRLHYSADPAKRRPEWRLAERKKYGVSEWNREHELIWESVEGKAVYADWWEAEFHISKVPLGWNPKYPVLRGWDFGLNGACVFAQLFPHMRLFILREAIGVDIGFERFVEEAHRFSTEWFPGATFIEFIDPTGRYRFGADERTYASMLTNPPIKARKIFSGANDMAARIKGVTDFLKEHVKGLPCYIVDKSCDTLIKGFNGGYHYAYDKHSSLKDKPEKNHPFSDVHDGNAYLCSKVRNVNLNKPMLATTVVEPRYGRAPDKLPSLVA